MFLHRWEGFSTFFYISEYQPSHFSSPLYQFRIYSLRVRNVFNFLHSQSKNSIVESKKILILNDYWQRQTMRAACTVSTAVIIIKDFLLLAKKSIFMFTQLSWVKWKFIASSNHLNWVLFFCIKLSISTSVYI